MGLLRASTRSPERGSASVEHAALVLLMALVACAIVAVVAIGRGPGGPDGSLASAIAFKQRCAVRYPDPCWQDPLTEAYGRSLAGAVRALAPATRAQDRSRRHRRRRRRLPPLPAGVLRDPGLHPADHLQPADDRVHLGRRPPSHRRPRGHRLLDLPADDRLGADPPRARISGDRRLRRHAPARLRRPGARPARDAPRPRRRPLPFR